MASLRQVAMQCVGRPVVCHSQYGVHYGILHHVDDSGLYIVRTGRGRVVSGEQHVDAHVLGDGTTQLDAKQVFWPLIFIPWAFAFALYPWGWWW